LRARRLDSRASGESNALVVGRTARRRRVAVGEFPAQAREFGDLGRADEGEIPGWKKIAFRLPGKLASVSVSNALRPFSSGK
jgi:hypothetical protein